VHIGVVGLRDRLYIINRIVLGKQTKEGESPVGESYVLLSSILSRAEPEKLCLNPPAPSGKPKYYRETDSEQVL
jgi:hypothetical protein